MLSNCSLESDFILNDMDAVVELYSILLNDELLLNERIDLLLEEVDLVDVI